MMISSKGRYALRVMIDLAEHAEEGYIPLQTIAARQGISEKYLESILAVLSKAKLLDAVRGKGGGYPSGLLIGTVDSVQALSNQTGQTIYVRPIDDFQTFSIVSVIVEKGDE